MTDSVFIRLCGTQQVRGFYKCEVPKGLLVIHLRSSHAV